MDQKIDPSSDKSSRNFDARSQISLQKGPKTIPFCTTYDTPTVTGNVT